MPGRIRPVEFRCKFIEIDAGWSGCKFIEITLHAWSNLVVIISMDLQPIRPVEFDQAWNTGQIGLKFTEITLYASLVELGIIPMNSTGIYLNGFTPNLTGLIWPVGRIWLVGQIWPVRIYNSFWNAISIKGATAPQSLIKIHRTKNGLLEKLDFSMPCCSILLTDSECTTLFEMPSILSQLESIKVRKSIGRMVENNVILHVAN